MEFGILELEFGIQMVGLEGYVDGNRYGGARHVSIFQNFKTSKNVYMGAFLELTHIIYYNNNMGDNNKYDSNGWDMKTYTWVLVRMGGMKFV